MTARQLTEARRLRRDGYTAAAIASELQVPVGQIAYWTDRDYRAWRRARESRAVELLEAGVRPCEVAREISATFPGRKATEDWVRHVQIRRRWRR